MNLKELRENGGIVPATPVKREITWVHSGDDGEVTDVFTVLVRKASFGTIERLLGASTSDDRSMAAAYISESILLGEDGGERLSYEDAYQLEPSLARLFMEAINAVNGTGDEPKN